MASQALTENEILRSLVRKGATMDIFRDLNIALADHSASKQKQQAEDPDL